MSSTWAPIINKLVVCSFTLMQMASGPLSISGMHFIKTKKASSCRQICVVFWFWVLFLCRGGLNYEVCVNRVWQIYGKWKPKIEGEVSVLYCDRNNALWEEEMEIALLLRRWSGVWFLSYLCCVFFFKSHNSKAFLCCNYLQSCQIIFTFLLLLLSLTI